MIKLCECGCDQEVSKEVNKYVWGHNHKGKTYEEIYGEEAKKQKEIRRDLLVGRVREDMKGDKNPSKKLEVKQKMSKEMKQVWSNSARNRKLIDSRDSLEFKRKTSERMKGDNNPKWNPDREEVFTPYTELFFDKEYRGQIKREQGYKDLVTDKELVEKACLHHIDYNKQNDSRKNLIWLNNGIHMKTNFNKEEWKIVLEKINKVLLGG